MPPPVPDKLQPAVAHSSPFRPIDIATAASRSHEGHCALLASRGFCTAPYRMDMHKFCRNACDNSKHNSFPSKHEEWSKMSLFDFSVYDTSHCLSHGMRRKLRPACADVDNLSQIGSRGWAIRRGLVPPHELDAMVQYVHQIREPARSMCGAGGFQPGDCFLSGDSLRERFPSFHRSLTDMLEGWISSGFHERASLGWPLRPSGGMFINIQRWKHDRSASCIFRALLAATRATAEHNRKHRECIAKHACESLMNKSTLWNRNQDHRDRAEACLECWWRSLRSLPRETVRSVVAQPRCAPLPIEMSFLRTFSFTMSSDNAPRPITEMHGWLAIMLNDTSTWQGFHPWHQDGPPKAGRSHKAFVLISKNATTALTSLATDPASRRTNLLVTSAAARYASNCDVEGIQDFAWDNQYEMCAPRMLPGDVLFFREDVTHRTQDALLDRLALIVDILRLPLRSTPLNREERNPDAAVQTTMQDSSASTFAETMETLKEKTGVALGCDISRGAVSCRK